MFRNCINDGSGPAVYALQRECTNRPKVLCSKGKVLSVGVKRCRKASGKCNGVECKCSTDDVSKGTQLRAKLLIFPYRQDIAVAGGCLLVTGSPALRWQELYTGVYTKRERLTY